MPFSLNFENSFSHKLLRNCIGWLVIEITLAGGRFLRNHPRALARGWFPEISRQRGWFLTNHLMRFRPPRITGLFLFISGPQFDFSNFQIFWNQHHFTTISGNFSKLFFLPTNISLRKKSLLAVKTNKDQISVFFFSPLNLV